MTWSPGPAWLFCPADRPERYAKALGRADVVVLDLEDAVAASQKDAARRAVRGLIVSGQFDPDRTVVRINGVESTEHSADRDLLAQGEIRRIMLAKTECVEHVQSVRGYDVVALVETARGVRDAAAVAEADGVVAMMIGIDDLAVSTGGTASRWPDGRMRDVARFARSAVLLAAKAAGRLAVDAVHLDIPDVDGLSRDAADAAALGFDAKPAIHPSQLEVIREAYRPTPEQTAWATRLLEAVGEGAGVSVFEGRMVDGPVYAHAARILRRAADEGR